MGTVIQFPKPRDPFRELSETIEGEQSKALEEVLESIKELKDENNK